MFGGVQGVLGANNLNQVREEDLIIRGFRHPLSRSYILPSVVGSRQFPAACSSPPRAPESPQYPPLPPLLLLAIPSVSNALPLLPLLLATASFTWIRN